MRVSVVTVCFNAGDTIADALRSVNAQTYPDLEHIVVDGGSTDGTVEAVRRHGQRVSTMVSEPDHGIYDAMNKGLAMATGRCVTFLNADDWYVFPDAISTLAAAMEARRSKAAYANVAYVSRQQPNRRRRTWRSGPMRKGAFARGWAPPHPTFMADRAMLLDLGGFDRRYRLAADFDLMLRMLEVENVPVAYVDRELVHMRSGGATGGGPADIARQNLEIILSLWRAGFRTALPGFIVCKALARARQRLDGRLGPAATSESTAASADRRS
jgi:glycosyltransferase involved in cell wall biosynthesis